MLEKFIPGWFVNSFCILHLLFIDKSRLSLKLLALPILAIPYLGTVLYLIIFVWEIPPPISKNYQRHQQEEMILKDITGPGQSTGDDERMAIGDTGRLIVEDEHFEGYVSADDVPTRSGRSRLWLRLTMFVLGLALWVIGIQSLKVWLFNPLFLVGGGVLLFLSLSRWNKSQE